MKKVISFIPNIKIKAIVRLGFILLICSVCLTNEQGSSSSGSTPSLNIKLNPPEVSAQETTSAINDLFKLENDLRLGLNDDFDVEKKKMIEIQKSRIHDIVHGGFIALNALIPNPIKSSIRKSIRDYVTGTGTRSIPDTDVTKAVQILDPTSNIKQAGVIQANISKLAQFRQRVSEDFDDQNMKNLIDSNKINLDYGGDDNLNQQYARTNQKFLNSELYETNFPVMRPL